MAGKKSSETNGHRSACAIPKELLQMKTETENHSMEDSLPGCSPDSSAAPRWTALALWFNSCLFVGPVQASLCDQRQKDGTARIFFSSNKAAA